MMRKNVQVYVFNEKSQKILMLKRIPSKAGYWQPVCGGIEKGESSFETAKRELAEETGIETVKEWTKLPFKFTYNEPKNGLPMKMEDVCYLATLADKVEIKLSHEHEDMKWIKAEEIHTLTEWDPILTVCNHIIEKVIK